MEEKIKVFIKRRKFLIIAVVWLVVQLLMFYRFGFKTGWEGGKYQEDARMFLQNGELNPVRLFFSAYSLLIALFIKTGLGLKGVILFQAVYSFCAVIFFFKLAKLISKSRETAFISTLIFVITPQIQMWNFHLYTESIFINTLVIFSFFVLNFQGKARQFILLILLLFVLSYQRPPGIAAALPAVLYFIFEYKNKKKKTLGIALVMGFIIVLQSFIMLSRTANFDEFFFATKNQLSLIGGYNALPLPSGNFSIFIVFVKALIIKAFYFFTMWRPYFSFFHNVMQLFFFPLYIFAVAGLFRLFRENKAFFLYFFLLISGYSALFIFTYVNYHCRYVTVILPFVIITAGMGIEKFVSRFYKKTVSPESESST